MLLFRGSYNPHLIFNSLKVPILQLSTVRSLSCTSILGNQAKENSETLKKNKQESEEQLGDVHFKLTPSKHPLGDDITKKVKSTLYWDNPVPHHIYSKDELLSIQKTHHDPIEAKDRLALFAVKLMRSGFDFASRYKGPGGGMTKRDWLNRCLFLETVAGVPGTKRI